jgi:hypothetical protein
LFQDPQGFGFELPTLDIEAEPFGQSVELEQAAS